MASGTRQGYNFLVETFRGSGDRIDTFVISAEPVNTGVTGNREFYLTELGEVIEGDAEDALGISLDPPYTP